MASTASILTPTLILGLLVCPAPAWCAEDPPARTRGARLAKSLEYEKNKDRRATLLNQVTSLTTDDKKEFVAWAKGKRKAKGSWKRLGVALGMLGIQSAAAELGVVARTIDESDNSSKRKQVVRALEGLTACPARLGIPQLFRGLRSTDRGVRGNHAMHLTRYLAEGRAGKVDRPLLALRIEVQRFEDERIALADQEEQPEQQAKLEEANVLAATIVDVLAKAFVGTADPEAFLRATAHAGPTPAMAAGLARGMDRRLKKLSTPLRIATQRLARLKRPPSDPNEEEETLEEWALRLDPTLKELMRTLAREKRLYEDALAAAIADRQEPEVLTETFRLLPSLLDTLDESWAGILIPALEHEDFQVKLEAFKTLKSLTNQRLQQSRVAWQKWWDESNEANDEEQPEPDEEDPDAENE